MLRLPPRSPEGEIIGILLNDPQQLALVQAGLSPEDFDDPVAKTAYLAILELVQQGRTPSAFALQSRMPSREAGEQIWLWQTDAIVANLPAAMQDVKERTAWRHCHRELTQILSQYDRLDPNSIPDKLMAAAALLDRVLQPAHDQTVARQSTGIPKLDDLLGGGWPTDAIVVIGGAHGTGRSTLLETLLQRGTPPDQQSLLVLTDSSVEGVRQRLGASTRIEIVTTLHSLPRIVLQSRLRPVTKPYRCIGIDSIRGLEQPEPTAMHWRLFVRRLRTPLFLVTNLVEKLSPELSANADIVFEMRKDGIYVHRNRVGSAGLTLTWPHLKAATTHGG